MKIYSWFQNQLGAVPVLFVHLFVVLSAALLHQEKGKCKRQQKDSPSKNEIFSTSYFLFSP